MNIKNLALGVLVAGFVASCGTTETKVENVTLSADTKASTIEWRGEENDLHFHTGTIALKEGELIMNGDSVVSGKFVVDMNSIDAKTEGYPAEKMAYLNLHLRDSTIFNVAKFPTATVTVLGYKNGKIDAEFEVLGVKMKQEVPAKLTSTATSATLAADFQLNITDAKIPFAQVINPETSLPALNPNLTFKINLVLKK
ncbi:MAG: YceI family protein [Bacteroidota bacterium]